MMRSNWLIITIDCVVGKIVNRHILYNATAEEAKENAENSRFWFTNVTNHFCDSNAYIHNN